MFPVETLLADHLQHNVFPPQPVGLVPYCLRAIELIEDGEPYAVVDVDNGTLQSNGREVTAAELVEELHLDGFVGMIDGR
jgi:hypothetical protein